MKKKIKHHLYEWTLIVLSALCNAIGAHIFIYCNKFAPGGAAGVVNMINHFIGNQYSGFLLLAINTPLLILAFIYLSKSFAIKTTANIVLAAIFLEIVVSLNFPEFIAESEVNGIAHPDNGKAIMAAAFGGVFMGVSLAFMFMAGGSTGGSDIPAAILQKKNEFISVSWMVFFVNAIIVTCSAFVYSFEEIDGAWKFSFEIEKSLMPVLLSVIYMLCASVTSDTLLSGGQTALKFEVVTQNPDELGKELLELHHGVTRITSEGMYSHETSSILICVIPKREITDFKRILSKYPGTFAYRTTINEVIGKFRKNKNDEII